MTKSATDFANYFIRNGFDNPRNTRDGNMKLQKMLFFSQLIHLATTGRALFSDDMYAYINGTIIENVMNGYRYNFDSYVNAAMLTDGEYSQEELNSLSLCEKIFGKLDAKELSELNHQLYSWVISYQNSRDEFTEYTGYHHKHQSLIKVENILEHDLDKIQKVIKAFQESDFDDEEECYELVNGKKFYFDSELIVLNNDLMEILQSFDGKDSSYTVYYDENAGYVIY